MSEEDDNNFHECRRQLDKSDPNLASIFTPELEKVAEIFRRHDFDLRIAGGAVRDILMGRRPNDVDLATTATPAEMTAMFESEGLRMINEKGAEHGTITIRIDDRENFEITTLRIDVETDGRRAQVEFTRDWRLDANRRDLTVNAMFLTFDGVVVDFFGGEKDLREGRIAFVGNPAERIQEDYLRILRYFRFYGRLSSITSAHESPTLDAIHRHRLGLDQISGERIWDELKKILVNSPSNAHILLEMHRLQLLPLCGFPEDLVDADLNAFQSTCGRCDAAVKDGAPEEASGASIGPPLPMTLLADLLKTEADVTRFVERLKISRAEKNLALFLTRWREFARTNDSNNAKTFKDLIVDRQKEAGIKDHVMELLKYKGDASLLGCISNWTAPRLPVTGFDLIKAGVDKGKRMNAVLLELTRIWKESDFSMTKEELIDSVVT